MTSVFKDGSRELILFFDSQFLSIHTQSRSLISSTPIELVYQSPRLDGSGGVPSMGEYLLRSAAAVERTFGGITASLWDDPFEWTLPEQLSTSERLQEYFDEVEATRQRAFVRFVHDSDLAKEVLVPAGNTQALIVLLTETLLQATNYQGRALALLPVVASQRTAQVPH
jgi:hypothetical protein